MEFDQLTANAIMQHKKQIIALLDETIDQKKMLFKQLMNNIENLGSEIHGFENERKTITNKSAEKSMQDCQF